MRFVYTVVDEIDPRQRPLRQEATNFFSLFFPSELSLGKLQYFLLGLSKLPLLISWKYRDLSLWWQSNMHLLQSMKCSTCTIGQARNKYTAIENVTASFFVHSVSGFETIFCPCFPRLYTKHGGPDAADDIHLQLQRFNRVLRPLVSIGLLCHF